MCRVRQSWKRRIVRFNIWTVWYISWALGIFPFIYDAKAQRLRRSRCIILYGILVQAGLMFVIFYYYSPMDNANNMELYRHNPLVENITHLHYILITAAVIVIHLQNWRQSESIGSTINALWKLHQCYFKHYDSLEIFTIDNYILWKVVAILLEVISMIALDCLVSPQLNIQFVLGLSSVLASQISIMLIGMHFHLALIYIYRFVWIINYQLLELVGKPGNPEASKIHQLHCIYRCLLDLNLQLVAIYECLTVLFFSSIVSANISSVYYFLVYAHNLKEPVTGLMLTNIIHVVLINVLDFWLHITICERSVRASRGTSRILKLFVNVPSQDVALDRSINHFALFCSCRRLEFYCWGIFHVDHAMGFRMIIASILYLVYLVQFDYVNLL